MQVLQIFTQIVFFMFRDLLRSLLLIAVFTIQSKVAHTECLVSFLKLCLLVFLYTTHHNLPLFMICPPKMYLWGQGFVRTVRLYP
jgi:hypothetical protein